MQLVIAYYTLQQLRIIFYFIVCFTYFLWYLSCHLMEEYIRYLDSWKSQFWAIFSGLIAVV